MKQINKHTMRLNDSKCFINYIVLVLLAISQSSCFQHFYQTNTNEKVDASSLKKLDTGNKYFVVHTPSEVFALKNLKVDSKTISGERDSLGKNHTPYLKPKESTANRYPKKYAETVFSEVHLYVNDTVEEKGDIHIAISQISKVNAYGPDKKADKNSKTMSIIGLSLVPVVAIGIFAATYTVNLSGL